MKQSSGLSRNIKRVKDIENIRSSSSFFVPPSVFPLETLMPSHNIVDWVKPPDSQPFLQTCGHCRIRNTNGHEMSRVSNEHFLLGEGQMRRLHINTYQPVPVMLGENNAHFTLLWRKNTSAVWSHCWNTKGERAMDGQEKWMGRNMEKRGTKVNLRKC